MNQSDFDELLERLADESQWLHLRAFAGQSDEIRQFVDELKAAQVAEQSANPAKILLFVRYGNSRRIDEAVINALEFPSINPIVLQDGCGEHNHNSLFGKGIDRSVCEHDEMKIVVKNIHHLDDAGQRRLTRYLRAWLPFAQKQILLIGQDCAAFEETRSIFSDFTTGFRYPTLTQRIGDLVYELHLAARSCRGGLDSLNIESVKLLLDHAWPGDIGEIDSVMRRIFREMNSGRELEVEFVRSCIAPRNVSRIKALPHDELIQRWNDLVRIREQIDQLTTSFIGAPFFAQRAETFTQRPLGSGCSEFDFFRLVSWSYMMLVECGGPNVLSFEKLAGGLQVQADQVSEIKTVSGRLRTYLQHSLQYASKSDQATIDIAGQWFDKTVGRLTPQSHDYEVCVATLIGQLTDAFHDIRNFLRLLNEDEYKTAIIRQWKDRVEKAWPKHELDSIVGEALGELGRSDLDPIATSMKLLGKMQERLKVVARDENPRELMLNHAKSLVRAQFPKDV
ncbi:hypothetical protein CA51_13460 [Rosistilla oblonga]|uniref:hypothetical protein n=1 Tax=Rosistilla oblonga TaxID=2527990 RepID=UPI00118BAF40|nr:hypothetical protein [Rosistilla oblonga]QDV11482.1 hypothetical protein CA51_13460 [Rosistilla oblonga]